MSAKLERFLNRLLLVIICSSATSLALHHEDPASSALYFLAAVAFGGLFTPIPTLRADHDGRSGRRRDS